MSKEVKLGHKFTGVGHPVFITAEIGINHNGDIDIAKKLIDKSVKAGCDAVKFQKRTVDVVYTPEELARPRENPFGPTNGDLKRGLELGLKEYKEIDRYCKEKNILWFASCWDEGSVDFIEQFDPPCYKVPSACLTDKDLLKHIRDKNRPIILSTGMSSMQQIKDAIEIIGTENTIITQCTSTYPSDISELNLNVIKTYIESFDCPVGYSGHEVGLIASVAAVALGAVYIERHITLNRAMWGSDQAASVEPEGMRRLVRYIRSIETALGDGVKTVHQKEIPILKKLRRK